MTDTKYDDPRIAKILKRDPRYDRHAYYFVADALEFTVRRREKPGHISGEELLDGIRDLAIARFGRMAKTVFNQWGVTVTNDFGNIVFNMVDIGLLTKQDSDSIQDFDDRFDFADVFERFIEIDWDES